MAVQLFKTFLNQIPYIIPAKWNIAIVWLFRTGQNMKKAHTGESGLKWEAKDSSKLSEIRTTHYGGYHRRWLGFGNQVDYVESKLSAHRCVTPS